MRGRVFDSFSELLYERGYDALTLAEIAKAAGMARTAIYNYFPDKETLLLAFTDHEMDSVFSDLRVELYRVDDPIDRLRVYVRAQLTLPRHATTCRRVPRCAPCSRRPATRSCTVTPRRSSSSSTGILGEAAADGRIAAEVLDDRRPSPSSTPASPPGRVRDLDGDELEAAIAADRGVRPPLGRRASRDGVSTHEVMRT